MNPGERFKEWIDSLAEEWKDRLRGWMASWAENAVKSYMDAREPEIIASTQETINKLLAQPNLPPELRALLEASVETGDITTVFAGWVMTILGVIPSLMGLGAPLGRTWEYTQDNLLHSFRLDPQAVVTAWRRDPAKYAWLFNDLRDLGWHDDRIEALKFITQVIPNAADIVRFALREVYSPEIAEQYGQFQDIPDAAYPDAARAGLSEDMFNKYWAAHWGLPSASDGFELLHRGILTEDQLKGLLKANDIMPYWRDQLIKLSWNIPTRVDVRRFWDMRTIDEARLREIYTGLGYHGQDLDDYVLWTKIYTDFPDLLARYKNGWITIDQVKVELVAMGMKPERAETMIQEKMKNATIERTVTEKDLTAADIIKGVLKNVITRAEATTLLVSIGYSTAEAAFKLAIGAPEDEEAKAKAKRELTKGDIAAAVKALILTPAEAIPKLVALRYKLVDATFLSKIYAAQIPIEKVEPERDLTKGDITGALKAGIILPARARLMLQALRYSAEEIEFLVSNNMPKPPAVPKEKELAKGDITSALRRGLILPDVATSMLLGLLYGSTETAYLVQTNMPPPEKVVVEKQRLVEKSAIQAAFSAGVITDAEAVTRLVALQYSPDDATFLVALFATQLAIEQAPKERQRLVASGDVMTALNTGAITDAEAISRLVTLGYLAADATFLVALERRVTELKAVTKPKEESRADVTTAVKKGLITPEEGYLMLLNLDFSPDAAVFILSIVAEESPFSPMNYTEFQDIANKWRLAAGLGGTPMPEEIKKLGAEVVRLSAEVSAIEGSIKAEKGTLLETEGLPATATARLRELQSLLYKAQAELARVKTDYNAKVAEWRHA